MAERFDCVVAGGGHAGCEAALALAARGFKTLLISGNLDRLGYLSCNPAIGGLAKGHLTREIDALGGWMGRWADEAGVQFRRLNMSKGPAVRATRGQMDRAAYAAAVKRTIYGAANLRLFQDNVTRIHESGGRVTGVETFLGFRVDTDNVVLTPGTFLEGKIHVGLTSASAGRMGDPPSRGLSACLKDFGHEMGRLKTGTTPRLLKSSVNFAVLEEQKGDDPAPFFGFLSGAHPLPQISCHVTWTNERAHEIIRSGFDRSPLFTGVIEGVGARYCPSVEDKVARFPDRERHQIFLEPEGLASGEIYANGVSTSLPLDIQQKMINAIKGLENAVIARPGYAIEYDYSNPAQLWPTFESKLIRGLWLAGQINGTSGYEEAAAQGLWAALNVIARLEEKEPFLPGRDKAYMAVLADDLVTLGTREPYRMFTSRAERRLLLREDNADARLTPLGRQYGLVDEVRWRAFCEKMEKAEKLRACLRSFQIPGDDVIQSGGTGKSVADALREPAVSLKLIAARAEEWPDADVLLDNLNACDDATRLSAETDLKYAGYLKRQEELVRRSARLEGAALPPDLDYTLVAGLSREAEEKLMAVRPLNLGQAARVSGITPAAISCLEIHLRKLGLLRAPFRERERLDAATDASDD